MSTGTLEDVARHPTSDIAAFAEMLEKRRKLLAVGREYLPGRSQNARSLYRDSLIEAGLLQRVEPDSPSIVTALHRAGRAAAACCDLLTPGEGPVVLDIMDGPVTAPRASTNTLIEVSEFADGFYAALAADDEATLDRLAVMDVQLLRMTGVFPEEYSFHWARALQGFHLGAPWAVEACMAALRESAPERLRNGPASTACMFFKSSLEMELMVATASDPAQFGAVLLRALQNHRRYFEEVEPNPGEDQSDDPLGFIALGPTAFAAAMSRRGWPITARSDYLPRCVLSA